MKTRAGDLVAGVIKMTKRRQEIIHGMGGYAGKISHPNSWAVAQKQPQQEKSEHSLNNNRQITLSVDIAKGKERAEQHNRHADPRAKLTAIVRGQDARKYAKNQLLQKWGKHQSAQKLKNCKGRAKGLRQGNVLLV